MDYYWVIEDDTLFPFDTLERYMKLIDVFKADIISGVSYYWHSNYEYKRNFWNIIEKEHLIGNKESDGKISIETITEQDSGIIKIGATGLGNVLAKAETVWGWKPAEQLSMNICNGADIGFFYHAKKCGYKAFGVWDIYLPHITKYSNGDIQIYGRIDTSLQNLINKKEWDYPTEIGQKVENIPSDNVWAQHDINVQSQIMEMLPSKPTVLEIGTFFGKGAACWALLGATVTTIDITDNIEHIKRNHKSIGVNVECLIGDSKTMQWDKEVDCVFIDGSHEYEDVKADINKFNPYAKHIIAGHDYNYPTVKQAVDEIFGDKVIVLGENSNIWVVTKNER